MKAEHVIKSHERPGRHWARIEEKGVYWGFRLMVALFRLLGPQIIKFFLFFVIGYFFLTGFSARRASMNFLTRVWELDGGSHEDRPGLKRSFRHFWSFGTAIVDKFSAWSGRFSLDDVDYTGLEIYQDLVAEGRGAIMVTAHIGNIEVCRALSRFKPGLKINVLVHTRHAGNFNRLLKEMDPGSQVRLMQVSDVGLDTAMILQEKLAAGEFVVIAADRIPISNTRHVTLAPFMGRQAPFPQGAFILASMLQSPVVQIFCVKRGDRFHIFLEKLGDMTGVDRKKRKMLIEEMVKRFAERLTYYAKTYPYQWFNFYDFWNQPTSIAAREKRAE